MSRFSDEVRKAYKRKWSYINNFTAIISPVGTYSTLALATCGVKFNDIELNVKDITVPQISSDNIEVWMLDRYRIALGKSQPKTVTITFRDFDQLALYRSFVYLYTVSKRGYADDYSYSIKVFKEADYLGEGQRRVFEAGKSIITSVSQVQFSNDIEAQIAEFSVEFYVLESTPPLPK